MKIYQEVIQDLNKKVDDLKRQNERLQRKVDRKDRIIKLLKERLDD